MPDTITLTTTIPASPQAIYEAWLDSKKHGDMTGGDASIDGRVGGLFSAWGDYIEGTTRELVANQRIVQEWRTTEWPTGAAPSRLEISLDGSGGGTELTMTHSQVPTEQAEEYRQGWIDFYWTPMRAHFGE